MAARPCHHRTVRVLLLLIVAGLAAAQTPKSAPPYPPPGKMVDLGGYRVHLYCTGEGSPMVMIVGGGFSFDWTRVQQEVSKTTRVCVYDPSGTAWSDAGHGRGCPAWVDEVRDLMRRADVPGPYVLVGLSAGAVIARLYAMNYANDVAGVVIVDHAFLPKPIPFAKTGRFKDLDSPPVLISMTPVIGSHADEPGFSKLPKEAQELDRWATAASPDLPTAETSEQCIASAEAAAHGNPHPLGRLPLVVISTGNQSPGYAELQQHLLSLSSNSRHLIAENSFHSVEISEPEVVTEGIRDVVASARGGAH